MVLLILNLSLSSVVIPSLSLFNWLMELIIRVLLNRQGSVVVFSSTSSCLHLYFTYILSRVSPSSLRFAFPPNDSIHGSVMSQRCPIPMTRGPHLIRAVAWKGHIILLTSMLFFLKIAGCRKSSGGPHAAHGPRLLEETPVLSFYFRYCLSFYYHRTVVCISVLHSYDFHTNVEN